MEPSHLSMLSATTFSLNSYPNFDFDFSTNMIPSNFNRNLKYFLVIIQISMFILRVRFYFNSVIDKEDLEGDFDLHIPLKSRSFRVKAYVGSVSKFIPKRYPD